MHEYLTLSGQISALTKSCYSRITELRCLAYPVQTMPHLHSSAPTQLFSLGAFINARCYAEHGYFSGVDGNSQHYQVNVLQWHIALVRTALVSIAVPVIYLLSRWTQTAHQLPGSEATVASRTYRSWDYI